MSEWIANDGTTPSIALVDVLFFDGDKTYNVSPIKYTWGTGAPVPIKAWRPTFPNEERIDIIAQNGNDGVHYEDKPTKHKTEYYQDKQGEDWLDECARTMTPEEFRGAMKFVIGKYLRRLGKKDNIIQELGKVADYNERWVQYETNLVNKTKQ